MIQPHPLDGHVEGLTVDLDTGERLYWCAPYCELTFRSIEARSIHRTTCQAFGKYADEVRDLRHGRHG